jgi:hypothetical protein
VTEPFITMSTPPHNQSVSRPDSLRRRRHLAIFMALLVIPEIKLSDKGLFDGEKFEFINAFV